MQANDTRNQHFLTRGEQQLNALNPQADPGNQRIYSFQVVDRENYTLALESPIADRSATTCRCSICSASTCRVTAACG